MAGRPRAMLKRIRDWEERADQLRFEVLAAMPEQYLKHGLGETTDAECSGKGYRCDLMAKAWLDIYDAAMSLTYQLRELGDEIVDRNERKGIRLEADQSAEEIDAKGEREDAIQEEGARR